MGIKERRERERQELKQNILLAAREIAARDGWQAVTVRKVAELVEYSPPTLYEYFPSKDAILQELVREGFSQLAEGVRRAYDSTSDPKERMVRLALSYCNFAWDKPELYQVMHSMGGASCNMEGRPNEQEDVDLTFCRSVRAAVDAAGGEAPDINADMELPLATLHGIVSLTMTGMLSGGREKSLALAERAMRGWLACAGNGS
jgi:AcrR family transcriptional regulator